MELSPSSVVERNPDILFEEVDGELVMLSIHCGKYFGLDVVGTDIWMLLDQPRSIGDVCKALAESYDVDGETCLREVTEFVAGLVTAGTVIVEPAA